MFGLSYQHVDEKDGHNDNKDNPEGEGDRREGDLLLCVTLSIRGLAENGVKDKLPSGHSHGLDDCTARSGEWGALQRNG